MDSSGSSKSNSIRSLNSVSNLNSGNDKNCSIKRNRNVLIHGRDKREKEEKNVPYAERSSKGVLEGLEDIEGMGPSIKRGWGSRKSSVGKTSFSPSSLSSSTSSSCLSIN